MSETTKLFWGSTLIAAGFGVATLFGPPEYDGTVYRPTVLSYDGVPVSTPSQVDEVAGGRAGSDVLRLRAEREPAHLDLEHRTLMPSVLGPNDAQNSVVHPLWERNQTQPQWLAPVPEVEPTSLVLANDSWGVQRAAAEEPTVVEATPSTAESTWRSGAGVTTPLATPAESSSAHGQLSDRSLNGWEWSDRETRADLSETPAGRPAYQTSTTLDRSAGWSNWQVPSAAEMDPEPNRSALASIGPDSPPSASPQRDEPLDVHIVVDGDSLPKLAGRYLKDPERAWEIYRLNRDLLPSPDLLPIGVVLKLPARDLAPQNASAEPDPASALVTSPHDRLSPGRFLGAPHESDLAPFPANDATSNLVPIRSVATQDGQAPEVRLLQPMPIDGTGYRGEPVPAEGNLLRNSTFVLPAHGAAPFRSE